MKLKSYLRGIGAGMIVAALIMGIAAPKGNAKAQTPEPKQTLLEAVKETSGNETYTDSKNEKEESVSDGEGTSVVSVSEPASAEMSASADEISESKEKTEFVDVSDAEPEAEPEPEGPPAIDPMPEDEKGYVANGETVLIRVIKGDSSVSVSRRIFEAGLVESAVELDRYLCDNHYDKSISVGEYEIAVGSDFETIAKTITRRK